MKFKISIAVFVLFLTSACATIQDASFTHVAGGETAIVLSNQANPQTTLVPVNLERRYVTGKEIDIGGEFGTVLHYSKERLTDYEINELEFPIPNAFVLTAFKADFFPEGHYAIVRQFSSGSIAGMYMTNEYCLNDAAPVLYFDSDNINYIETASKTLQRLEYGEAANTMTDPVWPYLPTSKDEFARVKFMLEEYPNISGTLLRPEVVALIDFNEVDNGTICRRGTTFSIK